MRRVTLLLAAFLAAGRLAQAGEVEIRSVDHLVDVRVTAAPLNEVLDRLSRQIGMKVIYESAVPRQLVTLTLEQRTPAEAVLGILEGLGLNYAMCMNAEGTDVVTLVMAGSVPASASSLARPAPAATQPEAPPEQEQASPPPPPEQEQPPPADQAAPAGGPPGRQAPGAQAQPQPPAGDSAGFPSSPFAPRPVFPGMNGPGAGQTPQTDPAAASPDGQPADGQQRPGLRPRDRRPGQQQQQDRSGTGSGGSGSSF